MSRQQFGSANNSTKVLSFQKSGATASFDPTIAFSSGSKRVSWRLDNGSGIKQIAGNSIIYTGFTGDSNLRTLEIRGNSFKNINQFNLNDENLYGNLNLSPIPNIGGVIRMEDNPLLTGITHSPSTSIISFYYAYNCNLTGNLDLTSLSGLGGFVRLQSNPNLTGVTHTPTTNNFNQYSVNDCNLIGDLNLTSLSGLGGNFNASSNTNLTGITHAPSTNSFNAYMSYSCNLTGNLDLSMLSGLGGQFYVHFNSNLTGITHTYSPNTFTSYYAFNCDLRNNLNLNMLPGLGGNFNISSNINLTGVTHTASTNTFSSYSVGACNLIGNHDFSMLQNMGGEVNTSSNPLLTGITFTSASTEDLNFMYINQCNIQGTLDLTPFNGFGSTYSGSSSIVKINGNSGLTNVIFPLSDGFYFSNIVNNAPNAAFCMNSCSLGYVDFKPLSGGTLISGGTGGIPRFELFGNAMTTADVNHTLYDLDLISTINYSGWTATSGTTGARLDITANSAPDGSSGGYNGTASTLSLASKGWTIFTD